MRLESPRNNRRNTKFATHTNLRNASAGMNIFSTPSARKNNAGALQDQFSKIHQNYITSPN